MKNDIKITNEIIEQIKNTSKEDLDKAIKMADKEYLQENMEVLEDLVEKCKECKFATCEQCEINWKQVQVIENLIKKNKEYKELIGFLENKICNQKQMLRTGINYKKLNVDELCKTFDLTKNDEIREKLKELGDISSIGNDYDYIYAKGQYELCEELLDKRS